MFGEYNFSFILKYKYFKIYPSFTNEIKATEDLI